MEMSEIIKSIWENNRSAPNSTALAFIADYRENSGIDKELIAAIRERGR